MTGIQTGKTESCINIAFKIHAETTCSLSLKAVNKSVLALGSVKDWMPYGAHRKCYKHSVSCDTACALTHILA